MDGADAVVIPGDGAFHDAMGSLARLWASFPRSSGAPSTGRRPFLGICLGYQLLFSVSEEFGEGRGLDVIPGRVRRFPSGPEDPAHGLEPRESWWAVCGSSTGFRTAPTSTSSTPTIRSRTSPAPGAPLAFAWCDYGVRFPAAMEWGLIAATQFHPEKSQRWGTSGCSRTSPFCVRERRTGAGMIVIPAVDVREGRCVRLRQGRADAETVFGDDPVAHGRPLGCRSARAASTSSTSTAPSRARRARRRSSSQMIAAVAPLPVSVGGGLRDEAAIEAILAAGARWAVVGTRAALDARFLPRDRPSLARSDHRGGRRPWRSRGREGLDGG